jgi:hypothetical protein
MNTPISTHSHQTVPLIVDKLIATILPVVHGLSLRMAGGCMVWSFVEKSIKYFNLFWLSVAAVIYIYKIQN